SANPHRTVATNVPRFRLGFSLSIALIFGSAHGWEVTMETNTKLASMPIEELWAMHRELAEILAAKIRAEKKMLERRLVTLSPATDRTKTRRPYPPVVAKFANPDEPRQVWSGRGRQPRWVKQKLSSGFALQDLSIAGARHPRLVSA